MASAPEEENDEIIRSPDVPFVSAIVGGLFPGRAIVVSGLVQPAFASDARRFNIDLCCGLLINGDHMDNKALHFNPRFDPPGGLFSGAPDRKLVINSYVSNSWGQEDRYDNPFEEGQPFQLRILVLEKYFKIAVNGRHVCDFAHRVPLQYIKTIFISGCVRLDFVEFQPPMGAGDAPVSLGSTEKKKEVLTTIERPDIPFAWKLIQTGFTAPQTAKFTLTPFVSAKIFSVNLMAKGEYLFHMRVDFSHAKVKAAVVRNNTVGGKWQTEERSIGKFPFFKGMTHDIHFMAYGRSLAIEVDGLPFIKFNYRAPDDPTEIDTITVVGDVILLRFVHSGRESE